MYTKQVGRFTIKIDYDEDGGSFFNPNDSFDNAILIADDRDFYTLKKGESFYQVVENNIEGKKIYPVYWNLYSSASNPVLRHLEDKITLEELEDYKKVVILAESKENAQMILDDWKHYFEDSFFQFMIENEDGDVVESCGGFQESEYDIEKTYCYQEALSIAEFLESEAQKEDKKLKKEAKKGSVTMQTTLADMLLSDNEQIKRLAKGIYKEVQK